MYTTKFSNKNISDISGKNDSKYITIGDKYVDQKDTIPARWKSKQFQCDRIPQNAGTGYFGYGGKAFTYVSEPYRESEKYLKTQPQASRKKGFGTGDANRRDEFAADIRTSQYRETLKKESRLLDAHRDVAAEDALLAKIAEEDRARIEKDGEKFLYDIGRSKTTTFDPKSKKDMFYRQKEKFRGDVEMQLGPYRMSSRTVGETAWDAEFKRPAKGASSATKNFFDNSHLQVKGL